MYKLLIVDDNDLQLKSLINYIDWKKYDIDEIYTAYNGEEGVNAVLKYKPDIVFVDFEMPVMNGIDMIKEVYKENTDIKFVVISCYDKFEYVKEAMNNYVSYYLLKPIDRTELMHCVENIIKTIEEEKKYDYVEQIMKKNIAMLIEGLLYKKIYAKQIWTGTPDDLQSGLIVDKFKVFAAVKITAEIGADNDDINFALKELKNLFETEKTNVAAVIGENNTLFALIMSESLSFETKLDEKIEEYKKILAENNIDISLTRSKVRFNFCELDVMLDEIDIFSERADINSYGNDSEIDFEDMLEELCQNYSEENLHALINRICPLNITMNAKDIRNYYVKIISSIQAFLLKRNCKIDDVVGGNKDIWKHKDKFRDTVEFRHWIFNMFRSVMEYITQPDQDYYERIIADMVEYININYRKQISAAMVASHVHVSESYARVIFRKYMNMTIQQYIVLVRMDEAKRLLAKRDLKIYEISEMVGYRNQTYFVEKFEKEVGMKPAQFRKSIFKKGE